MVHRLIYTPCTTKFTTNLRAQSSLRYIPGTTSHAISACFTRISVKQEALRSFLLARSPPAKNVTSKIPGGKCALFAEDEREPLNGLSCDHGLDDGDELKYEQEQEQAQKQEQHAKPPTHTNKT